ncbi:MAG TPA: ATP-binding protein [Candidatus Lokiarchaeia archaeon]|nr:ATP-binding protein [Candidatus Lokiarchaeia archaeon]
MILKETLRQVVQSQRDTLQSLEYGVPREDLGQIDLTLPFAIFLTGIRRCGKSTLLHQLMRVEKHFSFFNFEDTRVTGFEVTDFPKLETVLAEEYGECDLYFFDEIQHALQWEIFVRNLLDRQKHCIITGSNASLLSKDLGVHLTGRHLRHELFPFSYNEMLAFRQVDPGLPSFDEYLVDGGFPEYLKYRKDDILQELLVDILERDIILRHQLRSTKTIKEMALYLLGNIGNEFSYTNLKKTFNLGSVNSAISYVSYFEDSYLLFSVPKFDYSYRKQVVNPKKIYSIDNGLTNVNSVSFSADNGRMLENLVFGHLRRQFQDIFYFKGRGECDFVVKVEKDIILAIQVCYELTDDNTIREVEGLLEVLNTFGLPEGLILTHAQEDTISRGGKNIRVTPVWRWFIESSTAK